MSTIFERLDALETNVTNLTNEVAELEDLIGADSGWKNLTLANDVVNYNTTRPAQYRKIGNRVYLRGAVKGIKADSTVIGTLPSGYRPGSGFYFVQNMTYTPGTPQSHANFTRFYIKTNGEIVMQYTSDAFELEADNWFNLDTAFLTD